MSTLLSDVDSLYRGCATEPARWNDQTFGDWSDAVASSGPIDKELARHLRRIMNAARRIARFWTDADLATAPAEWESRVDVAVGVRAWRPQLELATTLLERHGDETSFSYVRRLFPVVTNQPFLDGIDYETWRDDRSGRHAGGSIAP